MRVLISTRSLVMFWMASTMLSAIPMTAMSIDIRVARPLIFVSPSKQFFFKLVPNSGSPRDGGVGYLFEVLGREDRLLYETNGWYSFEVFVSNDGRHLARVGIQSTMGDPISSTVGLAFYVNGDLQKEYTIADMVTKSNCLPSGIGGYRWLRSIEWAGEEAKGDLLAVTTFDGHILTFDIVTGLIVHSETNDNDCESSKDQL